MFTTCRATREATRVLKTDYDAKHFDVKEMRKLALKQQLQHYQSQRSTSDDAKLRKELLPRDGPAAFLRLLGRRDAATLAAFRYNRLDLNHLRVKRGEDAKADPSCPYCPGQPESVRHAVLLCPHYDAERKACQQELANLRAAMDYKSLLGSVESLPKGVQFAALRCVVKYLRSVRSSRGV